MAAPNNGAEKYAIQVSAIVKDRIRRLHRRAFAQGRNESFTRAFRAVIERLEKDPTEAGEPVYVLPGLRMQVRNIAIQPIMVDYAVSIDWRIVFIRGVKLLR